MTTKIFTPEDFKFLKISAISWKHKCSSDYVYRVLKGERERNTETARSIVKDAIDMLAIVKPETTIEA